MSQAGKRQIVRAPVLVWGLVGLIMATGTSWIVGHLVFPSAIDLPPSCPVPALLAHRSNSVPAAVAAARRAFCGVEVDVQWQVGVGMVVAHDPLPPTWTPIGSLTVPGLLDSLAEPPALLWLDFKNLSRRNAAEAAAYVDALVAQRGLQGRVIVESRSPVALWSFHRRAAATIPAYWIPPRPAGARRHVYDAKLALVLGALALPALSVPKQHLTPEFARRFRRFSLFTWTCNTRAEVRVATDLGARIILTDEDPSAVQRASSPQPVGRRNFAGRRSPHKLGARSAAIARSGRIASIRGSPWTAGLAWQHRLMVSCRPCRLWYLNSSASPSLAAVR